MQYVGDLYSGYIARNKLNKYGKALIRINRHVTEELQMQALYHEMLHGILVHIGRVEESQDEQLVQALANAMYQSFELRRDVDDA